MGRTDNELIATYAGKYGFYEIRRKRNIILNDEYYIYKDLDYWKSSSTPEGAVKHIKKYDPTAKPA